MTIRDIVVDREQSEEEEWGYWSRKVYRCISHLHRAVGPSFVIICWMEGRKEDAEEEEDIEYEAKKERCWISYAIDLDEYLDKYI